jgi:hypothetical protein
LAGAATISQSFYGDVIDAPPTTGQTVRSVTIHSHGLVIFALHIGPRTSRSRKAGGKYSATDASGVIIKDRIVYLLRRRSEKERRKRKEGRKGGSGDGGGDGDEDDDVVMMMVAMAVVVAVVVEMIMIVMVKMVVVVTMVVGCAPKRKIPRFRRPTRRERLLGRREGPACSPCFSRTRNPRRSWRSGVKIQIFNSQKTVRIQKSEKSHTHFDF